MVRIISEGRSGGHGEGMAMVFLEGELCMVMVVGMKASFVHLFS